MKLINHVQGSPEWLSWRMNGIGGSDAASIMGEGFMTPIQLYHNKLGLYEPFVNDAMKRGTAYEDTAREKLNAALNLNFKPICVESTRHSILRASLDGISEDMTCMLEIKTGGAETLRLAKEQKMPKRYWIQIQHCLNVCELDRCIYCFYDIPTNEIYYFDVFRDTKYILKLEEREIAFWNGVLDFIPPPLSDKDKALMEGELLDLAKELGPLVQQNRDLQDLIKKKKERMIELAKDQSCEGAGVSLTRYASKGVIDYSAIPELKKIDLEAYRKPPSIAWRVTVK